MPLNLPEITPGKDVWGQQINDSLTYLDEKPGEPGPPGVVDDESVAAVVDEPLTSAALSANIEDRIQTAKGTAFHDLSGVADGAVPTPHVLDSGHPFTLTNTGGTDLAVGEGALDIGAGTLGYLNMGPLPEDIKSFWFQVLWHDDGYATDEAAVVVVSNDLFHPVSGVAAYADAGGHLPMTTKRWDFQWRDSDNSSATVTAFIYGEPLAYEVWHTFGMTWDGKQATVWMPDGTSQAVTVDANITSRWGKWATVEIVGQGVTNRCRIRNWQISSDLSIRRPTLTRASVPQAKMVKAPETASTAIGGSFAVVATRQIKVPPSKKISVFGSLPVSHAGDGTLSLRCDVGGNVNSYGATTLLEAQAYSGMLGFHTVCDLSDFAVGTLQTVNVRLAGTGTVTFREQNSGPARRASFQVSEVDAEFA